MSTFARFETTCEAYVAGIPVAPAQTAAGQRLRHCLREAPHEFVQTALSELRVSHLLTTFSLGVKFRRLFELQTDCA